MRLKLIPIFGLLLFSIAASAQSDFNYSFYPAPKYTRIAEVNTVDGEQPKRDTVGQAVNVIVIKDNDRLSIRNLGNVSRELYGTSLSFALISVNGDFVYKAQEGETVIVNHALGTVTVIFSTCTEMPKEGYTFEKRCDTITHKFGGK